MSTDKIALYFLKIITPKGLLLVSALLVALLGISYSRGCFRLPFSSVRAYEAVPNSTALLLELNGIDRAATLLNTAPYASLRAWQVADKISNDRLLLTQVFERFNLDINASSTAKGSPKTLLCAALVSKASDFDYLYIAENTDIDLQKLTQLALDWHPNLRQYKGYTLCDLALPTNQSLTIGIYKGIFLAAHEGFLVEYAFDQLASPATTIWNNPDFQTVYTQTNHAQALVAYANLPNSAALSNLYLAPNAHPFAEAFSSSLSWVALAPALTKHGLTCNGIAHPNSTFLKALLGNDAQSDTELGRILPDNTAFFAQFNVGKLQAFQQAVNTVDDNANRYFLPHLDKTFAYILLEPTKQNLEDSHILAFKIAEKKALSDGMTAWAQALGKEDLTNYQNFTIQRLPKNDFSSGLFGANWAFLNNPYFTQLDNYIVFANSLQTLEVLIDKYNFNQLLAADPLYIDFLTSSNSQANIFIYLRPDRCFQLLTKFYIDAPKEENLQAAAAQWRIFSQISLSIKEKNGSLETKSLLQPAANQLPQLVAASTASTVGRTSLAWKAELQAPARTQPFLTKNPTNNEAELVIQDLQNRLYRIDRSGNIVWTVQLDQPIISEIQQVDFFKNKDLHYLFNTKNKIYCLDQYGKAAPNYPITLGSPATNGLLCIDYEGDREYAFYLACANGNWYGFSKAGKPLGGWNPLTLRGYFTRPLQHYRLQNKDYLLTTTEKGTLYGFTRYGAMHFEPKILTAPTLSALGCDPLSEPIKISSIDTAAMLNVFTLDGQRSNAQLRVGNGLQRVRAAIADVEGDPLKEYLLIAGKQLAVYGYRNKQLTKWWAADLEDELDDVFPVKLQKNTHHNIVLLSRKQKHLHLLDEAGVRYPDFPINASTRCLVSDFFAKGTDVLLGACDNIVFAYTLN